MSNEQIILSDDESSRKQNPKEHSNQLINKLSSQVSEKQDKEYISKNNQEIFNKNNLQHKSPEYEVGKILDVKLVNNNTYFSIKWKGYDDYYNTWEPKNHLTNCDDKINE